MKPIAIFTLTWQIRHISRKSLSKESIVSRDNYSYKKYQKELARKNKAEEKKQRKLEKKAMEAASDSGQASSTLNLEQK